jgi:hypothetical protein
MGKRRPRKLGKAARESRRQDVHPLQDELRTTRMPHRNTAGKEGEVGIGPGDARELEPWRPECAGDSHTKRELRKYQLQSRGSLRVEPELRMSQALKAMGTSLKERRVSNGHQTVAQRLAC